MSGTRMTAIGSRMTPWRALGGLRVVVGVFLLFTLIFQIVDLQIGRSLVPSEYFTFFTVDSTILNVALLILTGMTAWRGRRESTLLAGAAMAIVPYAIVTAAVYNVLLRGLPAEKYLGMDWPNEVLHVAVPAFLLIDWFIIRSVVGGRTQLPFRMIALAASFPVLWLAFTMVRGAITGWYPYPFLEPDGADGVGGVVRWIAGLFVFILALAAAAIAITRVGAARVSPSGAGGRREMGRPVEAVALDRTVDDQATVTGAGTPERTRISRGIL